MEHISATLDMPGNVRTGSLFASRYEVRELIGSGGMGAVYRVLDRELDEEVALKVLHAVTADTLARFRREVKLARRVTHPNVARTFDLGVHGEVRFLTMELITGEPVSHQRGNKLHLGEALRIAAETSRGLAAAHAASVVHRDLKPDNVMLAKDRVVITDFGIARLTEGSGADLKTGHIIGTPAYMAPEQLEASAVDGRTDVYALGVMLFELLTGRLPFVGEQPMQVAMLRLTTPAPDVRSLESVPEAVAELVAKALLRKREDRPDAQALLELIESARGRGARPLQRFTTTSFDAVPTADVATVQVHAFDGDDATLTKDLPRAVFDALTRVKRVTVLPATAAAVPGTVALDGTVRVSKDKARVRLRMLDTRRQQQVWSASVDGAVDDPFALEDAVVKETVAAAQQLTQSRDDGPREPELHARWLKAREANERFNLNHVLEAIRLCEEALTLSPNEPAVMALMADALVRAFAQTGSLDTQMAARGEELALRAIALEPARAGPYNVIASLRIMMGELRAGLRAVEETLRRMPLHAGAHATLGKLLCESGRHEEGLHRLELSSRLEPRDITTVIERIRTLAVTGRRDTATQLLAEIQQRLGPLASVVVESRLAVWFNDKALAKSVAERVRANPTGAAWEAGMPLMDSLVRGEYAPELEPVLERLMGVAAAPRQRGMMCCIGAEYHAVLGRVEPALDLIERGAQLPLIDLLWFDLCPALSSIRSEPRFAAARAKVAARVAELWS